MPRPAADEKQCPAMEANQLVQITDVTQQIDAATAGKSDRAFHEAERAAKAQIESACGTAADVRCQVVTLYQGGVYDSVQIQTLPGCADGVRAGGKRGVLRRRPGQFHLPALRSGRRLRAHLRQRQAAAQRHVPQIRDPRGQGRRHRIHQRQPGRHRARGYPCAARISARRRSAVHHRPVFRTARRA